MVLNVSSTHFADIETLVTNHGEPIHNAAVIIENGEVIWFGSATTAPSGAERRIDCSGKTVIPGFVDSHAHLAFAGDRSAEFAARMSGLPYAAGGIRTTVAATRDASDEQLRALIARRVNELHRSGVTTFETKSGYGLAHEPEMRLLRLSREVTEEVTFLGAHVAPDGIKRDEYLAEVKGSMLEASKQWARWVDVFCDEGAFTVDEAEEVLSSGIAAGLGARIHAAQLAPSRAIQMAVELGAASVDHCNHLLDADIDALSNSPTVATLLPAADFSTRSPYAPARRLVDAGATVALATNCNPGTSFTTNPAFGIAIAVREMGLTADEAVWSATAGGAAALGRSDIGHLDVGARADLVVLDAPNHLHLAYRPGVDLVDAVYKDGTLIHERSMSWSR